MDSKNRFWLKVGIGLVVLFLFDQGARNLELNKMLAEIQKSEVQMETRNADVEFWYGRFNSGYESFSDTELEIARIAGEYAPLIAAHGSEIENLFILPWHVAITRAKDDYLEHNDAWISALGAQRVIDQQFQDEELSQQIDNTFEIVRFTLPKAVPKLDLNSLQTKVEDIILN
jgi:hypothetical protein